MTPAAVAEKRGDQCRIAAGAMPKTAAQQILARACATFDMALSDLRSRCRDRRHVEARQYAAVRLRSELGLSNAVIGRLINRDHASVVHLRQRAERTCRIRIAP